MNRASVRVGVGTRFRYDGETVEVIEMAITSTGNEVVLKDHHGRLMRLAVRELLLSDQAQVIPDSPGPSSDDDEDIAGVVLARLSRGQREALLERAAHVRELLTGYRSGSAEMAGEGEPRPQYAPDRPLYERYADKAAELGVGFRTIERWVQGFRLRGEAGLAGGNQLSHRQGTKVDDRWTETALEVMAEHTGESKPSRTLVIERTQARVIARFGPDAVTQPSRATAFRVLEELERRHPLFRLSTERNRDIADRPKQVYGKLRPTRPGEYLLMDTTRLDVFAFDPFTLKWVQAELTVGMDWYDRCICGLRLTPVSTKAVDAAAVLYQSFRPRPAGAHWPRHAVWPEHGIPRTVLIDVEQSEGPGLASPPVVPETIVVDHGKIYVSEHLTSVCARMGISIQPARLRTGRDKGPVERFFRTLREDLLQALPGYKGPDIFSRGEKPEDDAFFFLDELEAIIREWVATVYHHRPHADLVDPGLPKMRMSPAAMFEHGLARAGYIEAPRDPHLAYEFLATRWRTIQHYGVEIDSRRYSGRILREYGDRTSPYRGSLKNKWPFQVDPDDVTKIYFRDLDGRWHTLTWEHAPSLEMPLSEDALAFARKLAASKYRYPDDRIAVADLLERWKVGLATTPAERRMILRLSREQKALDLPDDTSAASSPSVQKALEGMRHPASDGAEETDEMPEMGDDDAEDLETLEAEESALVGDDFYADALGDV
ncbi:MAG TPA: Mu transposase C-terminal domain-containing protein [Streptosporangiaceae bacterium]|nr:Mu transposase C-terminal domain-containing protein [Streptosporangiaceae bacterium]